MPQNPRQVPPLEALWRGLTADDVAILQEALEYFDGSYNGLMARLQELGASQGVYAAVNGAVAQAMGKPRSEVDLWSVVEMEAWGDGYQRTLKELDLVVVIDAELAADAAWRGFSGSQERI